jgi:hypothetical protein
VSACGDSWREAASAEVGSATDKGGGGGVIRARELVNGLKVRHGQVKLCTVCTQPRHQLHMKLGVPWVRNFVMWWLGWVC